VATTPHQVSINTSGSSLPMLVLIGILVFIYQFGIGIYYALGLEPLPSLEFLYQAALLCGVVWWLRADTRRYAVKQVYCLGLLVRVGWIILIPYHLFKTRGLRGLIPLVALIGIFIAAQLLAVFVYMLFSN
jgi:hypothetical protein